MKRLLSLIFSVLVSALSVSSGQLIVAHRGASHDAPENTMAAFHLAWEQGADAIEGDFYLSKDGEIVCVHDEDLKRVAGNDAKVVDLTLEELRRLDVGSWKDQRFASERIPTLQEVLATVKEGKQIFVEVKCGAEIVPTLTKVIKSSSLKDEQIAIISFNEAVVQGCIQAMPTLTVNWLTGFKQDKLTKSWSPSHEDLLAGLKRTKASGLGCKAERVMVDEALVKALRAAKVGFHCWTVDDVGMAKYLLGLGVDSITTNRPGWLRSELAK